MSFLNKITAAFAVKSAKASLKGVDVPEGWMPDAKMKRVIIHWTGGGYVPSSLDKEHYHILVDGDLKLHRGLHPITANEKIGTKPADCYAAHTRGANTGAIGVSICAMAGATPSNFGKYPLTEAQWQAAAEAVADLCFRYGITVGTETVLTHAEVQPNLGIWQRGKWDVACLPFNKKIVGAASCGDDFRKRVLEAM